MICLVEIILVRNPRTQHRWLLFFHLQNRPRVHRSFRMWIFPSAAHSSSFVVMPREILFIQNINAFRFFSRMWFEMSLDQNTKNSHKMPTLKPSKEIWIRTRLTNKRERSRDLFHVYHWMRVSLLFIHFCVHLERVKVGHFSPKFPYKTGEIPWQISLLPRV
jgi:hypothetical protein